MVTKTDMLAVGFAAGLGLGIFVTYNSMHENSKDTAADVTLYEGRHVIRTRESLDHDRVFIESTLESGRYVSLDSYLSNIKNEYDREIDRAKIEKIVGW